MKNGTEIIGRNPGFVECLMLAEAAASEDRSILISGETGTGKELFARLIHAKSRFSAGNLVPVNCGCLNGGLGQSDLFGHEVGAFTDAKSKRLGACALSMNGTLFFDEIGDLTNAMQPVLLRVLQEKEFSSVGSDAPQAWTGMIVSATNRDLDAMIARNEFRADLYFRLRQVIIQIPPLRDRKDDIPLLANWFLKKYCDREVTFGKGVLETMCAYHWPGNVRELDNVVQNMTLARKQPEIQLSDLPKEILAADRKKTSTRKSAAFRDLCDEDKRSLILKMLSESNGKVREAARRLEMDPAALRRLCKRLSIPKPT